MTRHNHNCSRLGQTASPNRTFRRHRLKAKALGAGGAWLFGLVCVFPAALAAAPPLMLPDAVFEPDTMPEASAAAPRLADTGPLPPGRNAPVSLAIRAGAPLPAAQAAAGGNCRRGPVAVGSGRPVPAEQLGNLAEQLDWVNTDGGGVAATFTVTSPGAKGLRIALEGALPEDGEIRFFSPADPNQGALPYGSADFQPATGMEMAQRRPTWSPVVVGETIGAEVTLPPAADRSAFSMRLRRISHLEEAAVSPVPRSEDPNSLCTAVDVSCRDALNCAGPAAVRLLYTEANGDSHSCTGTFVSDKRETLERLRSTHLVTARHCVSSQAVAETVEVWLYYETATCGSAGQSDRFTALPGGADLVVAHARTDHSLLRLRKPLPLMPLCWKGWLTSLELAGRTVHSIHHPRASLKEWAAGQVAEEALLMATDDPTQEVEVLVVNTHEGALMAGSSGAGLFADDDGALLGLLSGGPEDDCSINYYGRFHRFLEVATPFLRAETQPPVGVVDDFGDDLESATGVLLSSTTRGDLETVEDVDYFRIATLETGALYIRTEGPADTFGTLYAEDGAVLVTNDDDGPGNNFRIATRVTAGTYYVSVGSASGMGSYTLFVDFQTERRTTYSLPLLLPADNAAQQGFVRIINDSRAEGVVEITATDDAGAAYGPIRLPVPAMRTRHFNSRDLELGNTQKGLSSGTGDGEGDWRLALTTSLDIKPQAYARSGDGALVSLHGLAGGLAREHEVSFFNGAANRTSRSLLRLINPNNRSVAVTIDARDDQGQAAPEGRVNLSLPRLSAKRITAQQLEAGQQDNPDFSGRLGDGAGKWRLFIAAGDDIRVMNLIQTPDGRLHNLSASPVPGTSE